MSEDTNFIEEQSNQPTKRRKGSKWDIDTSITTNNSIPIKTNIPIDNINVSNNFINTIKQPEVIDIHVLQQQAQLAQYTQQIALQQAQQMGLQKVQQKLAFLQQPVLPLLQPPALLSNLAVPLIQPSMVVSSRIYIGSVNYDIRQNDMIALFSSFGTVTKCEMSIDPITGKSKGFCFIEYSDPASAEAAQVMDGFELGGRKIKVGRPLNGEGAVPSFQSGKYGPTGALATGTTGLFSGLIANNNTTIPYQSHLPTTLSLGLPSTTATTTMMMNTANNNPLQIPMQSLYEDKKNCLLVSNVKADTSILDIEKIFKAFGSISRCQYVADEASTNTKLLMVEYIETAHAFTSWLSMNNYNLGGLTLKCEVIASSVARQLLQPKAIPTLTTTTNSDSKNNTVINNDYKVLLLNNMITMEDAKDPELKDEISEEAMNYGELVSIDITVDEREQKAAVKLYFKDSSSANKAFKAMNHRVFAGNKIIATLIPE